MWRTSHYSFIQSIRSPFKTMYWLLSGYPYWVAQLIVGGLVGLGLGLFLRFFGRHILYCVGIASIVLWGLWYVKVIIMKPEALQPLLGLKIKSTTDVLIIVRAFIEHHQIECISALCTAILSLRYNFAPQLHA